MKFSAPLFFLHFLLLASVFPAKGAVVSPNILLVYADDIGFEALHCYGGLDFKTPHLDGMAEHGLRFSRAYTSPVCTPSRVSMHTGLYTTRHGHTNVLPVHQGTRLKVDFTAMTTYAQLLRAKGYATSVTGKWQLATLEVWPDHLREAGFDSWCVWQIWDQGKKTSRHWDPTFNQDGKRREDLSGRFGPDVLADYVIDQMKAAGNAGKPFLIVHNELLPHYPVVQTPEDRRSGDEASLGNMISYLDTLVGRLLEAVESLGIRETTYVVFMGDNGTEEEYFENPRKGMPGEKPHTRHTRAGNVDGGKHHLEEAGTHVPLLVWGPSIVPQGKVCEDLVDIVDLFPTFCELSGTLLPADLTLDGRSIAPQFQGLAGKGRSWTHQGIGSDETLFDGSWRFFRSTGAIWNARELPREVPGIASDSESREAAERLGSILFRITRDGIRPAVPF